MKDAAFTLRIEREVRNQLLIECTLMGKTMAEYVLSRVYFDLCGKNLTAAEHYQSLGAVMSDGPEKDKIDALRENFKNRAHYWKIAHENNPTRRKIQDTDVEVSEFSHLREVAQG